MSGSTNQLITQESLSLYELALVGRGRPAVRMPFDRVLQGRSRPLQHERSFPTRAARDFHWCEARAGVELHWW